jgi:hypothetical protein
MATIPLNFVGRIDRKITSMQVPLSIRLPVTRQVTFQLMGRGMESGGRLIDCLQSAAGFLDRFSNHCFLKSAIACSRVAEYPRCELMAGFLAPLSSKTTADLSALGGEAL